jgi:hypothetical protein
VKPYHGCVVTTTNQDTAERGHEPHRTLATCRAGAGRVGYSVMERHREFTDASTVWAAVAGSFGDVLALEVSRAEQATALAEARDRCMPQMLA